MLMHWKRRLKALSVSGPELRESVMSNLELRDFSIGLDSGAKKESCTCWTVAQSCPGR